MAASGITDAMLDSLIALKDLEGVEGLPPLSEIEEIRYEKNTRRSTRAEIERQKQEEVAKARVRQVDDKGRAYGTGRRKCSIARVWIHPGEGKFIVNDKEFDVYFPMLDHRAALLRPFSETKTLGLWDVNCTVKGGGVSGEPNVCSYRSYNFIYRMFIIILNFLLKILLFIHLLFIIFTLLNNLFSAFFSFVNVRFSHEHSVCKPTNLCACSSCFVFWLVFVSFLSCVCSWFFFHFLVLFSLCHEVGMHFL